MKKRLLYLFLLAGLLACSPKEKASYILPELSDVVIYQVNPRVFAPENSFQAITQRLDSIQALGCNILWFMPIYEIGQEKTKNSPYSVRDYRSVNPEFGTLHDFKKLVKEAHRRQLGVILDWVPNHTAWDHDWTRDHKDWYMQDSLGQIIYPEGTDWDDVADLNYDNPEMRRAMIGEMAFWIEEVEVDGFRCDAVDYVPYDFLKQCVDSLRNTAGKRLLMLAEGSREDHFQAGFDLNYGWDFATQMRRVYQQNAPAGSLFTAHTEEYAKIPQGKYKLRFTTNHDESAKHSPVVEWMSERGSMSAFAVINFMPDIPMVYGSQETGYPDRINFFRYTPINWMANPELWEEYQRLIHIRNQEASFRKGDLTAYPDDHILLFERGADGERCLVGINTRDSVQTMPLPTKYANKHYVNLRTKRLIVLGDFITLQPYEYLILK